MLIIKLCNIGNLFLTVPTIRAARDTFPDAYIAALVNKGTEDIKGPEIIKMIEERYETRSLF